jgi:hypothetical protein
VSTSTKPALSAEPPVTADRPRGAVNVTNGDDAFTVAGAVGDVNVTSPGIAVELLHAEATDQLDFEIFSGFDTVASGGLTAGAIQPFLDGVLIP